MGRLSSLRMLFLAFFVLAICFADQNDEISYGLMVDAGSGGTRIYVFKWTDDSNLRIEPIDSNYSHALKPGITTSIITQEQMDEYFQPLLEFAESKVPSNRYASTPLYFKATAGLRMMQSDDAQSVLLKVQNTFSNSKFLFQPEWTKIISGIDEGLFNWLTVNALHSKLHSPTRQMYGALDLGLSSTQISFVPEDTESIRSSLISLTMFNRTLRIYDRSFLGFGINEARRRMERTLPQSDSGLIVNPCLPKSYSKKTPWKAVMEGSSNYTGCMHYALALMKKEDCNLNCSIAGIFQPPLPKITFNARDHYARVVHFLGLPVDASIYHINNKAKELCSLDYQAYNNKYSKEPEEYCFEACYVVSLLRDGLGFPERNSGIHFREEISGADTSWTLGAMYFEIGRFSYSLESDKTLVDIVLAYAAAFGFIVVVALVLVARKLSRQIQASKKKET